MPRRLAVHPALEIQTKEWVRALLRVEMTERKITYTKLVELLGEAGLQERQVNLRNKVTRGELSAATLLLCLKVMGCHSVNLDRWSLAKEAEWNLDRALDNELVVVIDRDDMAGVYKLRIGELSVPVTIVLERRSAGGTTKYSVSHAIKTPELNEPHRAFAPFARDPERALRSAIRSLTSYYQLAVEAGHKPADEWLIPSEQLEPLPDALSDVTEDL